MSDHPTDPSPPPEPTTDPHGGTVATGLAELELETFDRLDLRGQLRWLAGRTIRVEAIVERAIATRDLELHQDSRHGLRLASVEGAVAKLEDAVADLRARLDRGPEQAAE